MSLARFWAGSARSSSRQSFHHGELSNFLGELSLSDELSDFWYRQNFWRRQKNQCVDPYDLGVRGWLLIAGLETKSPSLQSMDKHRTDVIAAGTECSNQRLRTWQIESWYFAETFADLYTFGLSWFAISA